MIGEIAHSDFDGGTFETGEVAESNAGGFGLMVSDSPPFGKVSLAIMPSATALASGSPPSGGVPSANIATVGPCGFPASTGAS